jgi:hypothetical protein
MNIEQINTDERKRLLNLIEKAADKHNKTCFRDDIKKLEQYPAKYWSHFNIEAFQPGTIIETQRLNTITAMQKYYSK